MARVKRYKFDLKYMQTVLHKSQSHRVFLANALTQFTFLVTLVTVIFMQRVVPDQYQMM